MRRGFVWAVAGLLAAAGGSSAQVPPYAPDAYGYGYAPPPLPLPGTMPGFSPLGPGCLPGDGGLPNPFVSGGDGGGGPCVPCVWGSLEYLLWWVKDQPIPFLVTFGNPADPFPGAIGQPGSFTALGAGNVYIGPGSGGRATVGCWFDEGGTLGFEGSAFFLEKNNYDFEVRSNFAGFPLIAIPFRTITGLERAVILSLPGIFPVLGRANFQTSTKVWGAEANGVCTLYRGTNCAFAVLAGARYIDFEEELELLAESTQDLGFGNGLGTFTIDNFDTRNIFYGGQIGARLSFTAGTLSLDITGKGGVGPNEQTINIIGVTTQNITVAGVTTQTVTPGGIFAQPSNMGNFRRSDTTAMAEAQAKVSWDVCSWFRLFAGYNFLWLDKTARPGELIDRTLDLPPAPPIVLVAGPLGVGPLRPQLLPNRSEFWVQGVSAGFELRY